jgi:hypothetical protein
MGTDYEEVEEETRKRKGVHRLQGLRDYRDKNRWEEEDEERVGRRKRTGIRMSSLRSDRSDVHSPDRSAERQAGLDA